MSFDDTSIPAYATTHPTINDQGELHRRDGVAQRIDGSTPKLRPTLQRTLHIFQRIRIIQRREIARVTALR